MHIVTGASSGIGEGVTLALAERGEQVIAVARRAEELQRHEAASAGLIRAVPADVATTAGRRAVVDAVDGAVVRSLTHAAGSLVPVGSWSALQADELVSHLEVHVAAPIALTSALLECGVVERMLFIDSYSSTTPRVGWSAYSIVKAAAQMSARSAAAESTGMRVIRAFPGAVDTPLLRTILDSDSAAAGFYKGLQEEGKVSNPLDVGRDIARILLDRTDDELDSNETWTVGHPA